jgi:hypothetical protein
MSSNQLELFTINYQEPEDGLVCIKCGIRQSEKQFYSLTYSSQESPKEIKRTCKTCNKKHDRILRYLRNTVPYPDKDYSCPICSRTIQEVGKYGQPKLQTWVLDHCHITETFRGWICHHCNTGIGSLGDNIDRLKNAVSYLKKHLTSMKK